MNKKYNFVNKLKVVTSTIALAGVVITLFSCSDIVVACDNYNIQTKEIESFESTISSDMAMELSLAPNGELEKETHLVVDSQGGEKDVLDRFVTSIISNSKSLDAEFSKVIDDNFWDLI